jgi:hypothetical protein
MRPSIASFAAALSLAVGSLAPLHANTATGEGVRKLNFDVFLDDRAIGYHRFELAPSGAGTRMVTQADFAVRVLRITAFEYEHRNTEFWQDGCLQSIDARTDSNGKKSTVNGRDRGSAFVLATAQGERPLGDCVATFAYWDKDLLLQSRQLLNSQTGEYLPVRIAPLGTDRIRIGQRDITVKRYALKGQGIDITLAYAAEGDDWVALDSKLEGGRTLRYRRNAAELGSPPVGQTARAGAAGGSR